MLSVSLKVRVTCVPATFETVELRVGTAVSITTLSPLEVSVAAPSVATAVMLCAPFERVPAVQLQVPKVLSAVHVFPVLTPSLCN